MMPKRVLVLGAGGREHALAWRLSRDPEPAELLVAPGNPGIARAFRCLALNPTDPREVVAACRDERIDLVVVGPEQPLAAGVADALAAAGTAVFGPTRAAARIETSKAFAKEIMAEAGVRTAGCDACDRPDTAREELPARPGAAEEGRAADGEEVMWQRERIGRRPRQDAPPRHLVIAASAMEHGQCTCPSGPASSRCCSTRRRSTR